MSFSISHLRTSRGRLFPAARPLIGLCLLVLLWSCPRSGEAAAPGLSLDEAVRRAVARAPALDARRAQTVAAQQQAHRAAALPDPTLMVGIDNLPANGPDAFDTGVDEMTTKRIGLRQAIPARAKRDARQALADRAIDQASALTVAERQAVRQATAAAWVSLWSATRELAALCALREESTLAVTLARTRLGSATGTAVDALAAQAVDLALENRIEATHAQVDAARATLDRWLGEDSDVVADATPDFTRLPASETQLLATLDDQDALRPWQAREQTAAAEVELARAERHPDWSVGIAYGQRERSRSDMLMLEFSIDLPLFPANRQDREVAAREAELEAATALRDDARRAQTERIRRDVAEWNSLKHQVARDREQLLPLARDRVRVALAAYGGGGAIQPWLDARRDEIDIRIAHARRLGEFGRAWAALAYLLPDPSLPPENAP